MADTATTITAPVADLPPWFKLAQRALRLEILGDRDRAARMVERIAREHTPNVIPHVLLVWADYLLADYAPPPGAPVRLGFANADTGAVAGADGVPAPIAWAGQLVAARAADDQATFEALINSVQDNQEWTARISATLSVCATNIRAAQAGREPRRG